MKRWILSIAVLLIIGILVCGTYYLSPRILSAMSEYELLEVVKDPAGNEIRILAANSWEGDWRPTYYVAASKMGESKPWFIGTYDTNGSTPQFVSYYGPAGKIVGLAKASQPNALIVIHDFGTNDSYPYQGPDETPLQREGRGYRLLDVIADANKSVEFTLGEF